MAGDWFTLRATPDAVELLDQRLLPGDERYLVLQDVEAVACAIEEFTRAARRRRGVSHTPHSTDTVAHARVLGAAHSARRGT